MRIAISTLHFSPGQPGAPVPYLTRLVEAIAKVDKKNEYILLTRPSNRAYFPLDQPNFSEVVFPDALRHPLVRVLCEQFLLPLVMIRKQVDVCHYPATVGGVLAPVKSVVSVQMIPDSMLHQSLSRPKRFYYGVVGRLAARRADRLIVLSETSRRDLQEWDNSITGKIVTVHPGADNVFAPERLRDPAPASLAAAEQDPFILAVATDNLPHENLPTLLSAFVRFRRTSDVRYRLVLVGSVRREYVRRCLVEREGEAVAGEVSGDVICTGFLPYAELPAVYARAKLFVQISVRECFPFTTLEAMLSGVPVLVSNLSVFPELVGDAGVLVDPWNADAVSEQMNRLICDERIRTELRQKALRRAGSFRWEDTARRTIDVYCQAAGKETAGADARMSAP